MCINTLYRVTLLHNTITVWLGWQVKNGNRADFFFPANWFSVRMIWNKCAHCVCNQYTFNNNNKNNNRGKQKNDKTLSFVPHKTYKMKTVSEM